MEQDTSVPPPDQTTAHLSVLADLWCVSRDIWNPAWYGVCFAEVVFNNHISYERQKHGILAVEVLSVLVDQSSDWGEGWETAPADWEVGVLVAVSMRWYIKVSS